MNTERMKIKHHGVLYEYNYVGQTIRLDQMANRRIRSGWAMCGKLRQLYESPIPQ